MYPMFAFDLTPAENGAMVQISKIASGRLVSSHHALFASVIELEDMGNVTYLVPAGQLILVDGETYMRLMADGDRRADMMRALDLAVSKAQISRLSGYGDDD